MLPLILAGIAFTIWALFIINTYYSTYYSSIDHINVDYIQPLVDGSTSFFASPFGKYFFSVLIAYLIYKGITLFFSKKTEIRFGTFSIIGFFLLHLFIVSVSYAGMTEGAQMLLPIGTPSGVVLFFHIIMLLLYPIALTLIARACGYGILEKLIPGWRERDLRITILADLAIGFFIFSILLLVLSLLGLYSLTGLIIILLVMIGIGWNGWKKNYTDAMSHTARFENHETGSSFTKLIAPRLISAEFSFFILTLMMSVAMISIIRPMPIGWDDLGVYMNFPKILALTGEALPGSGMYTWQLITGSGFLFSYTAAQAFFVNQLGSILAIIAISLGLSVLLESKGKKSFISLPILLATLYYVMPMTVFHHTKDMKLDPALLFVSISTFMVFFTFIKEVTLKNKNEVFRLLILVGVLLGFAFSIKVTTLMLVLAIFGLFAYRLLSFWGYMGFLFVFLAIFTGLNLWSIMNVWMPPDSGLLHTVAGILGTIGIVCFGISASKNLGNFKQYIIGSIILLLSFFLGLSPWIIKNTSEVKPWSAVTTDTKSLAIQSLLSGSGAGFQPEFTKVMTQEEYKQRGDIIKNSNISSDGQSQNEDFGRYFGYEEGINNYVRLPINLTFQKNQSGEFTSITYIFLALIPVLFLFARGRFPWVFGTLVSLSLITLFAYAFMGPSQGNDGADRYPIASMLKNTNATIVANEDYRNSIADTDGSIGVELGESIKVAGTYISDVWNILIQKPILSGLESIKAGEYITKKLSLNIDAQYPLLYGYAILLILNIIFIASIHFLTRDEEEDSNFREMSVVLNIYGFLFLVSAFGIVWYGIFVYFIFFALIGLLAKRFNTYSPEDEKNQNFFTVQSTLAGLLFLFIALYFVRTALPHAWTNLKSAGFNEYKYSILNQEETLFAYRADYLVPIATMNLEDTSSLTGVIEKLSTPQLKNMLTELAKDKVVFLESIGQIIPQALKSRDATLKRDGKILADYVYNKVLYPSKEDESTAGIYRIGTFMTYLINKNLQRYYDDSLIFGFEGYLYEESPEKTIEKMKTLGFKFLLIDLNAATIDRDPRRVLTQRYEHLLLTMRAKNLKLVNTDNLCLEFALDEYKSGKLQTPAEFIAIAGTNYESYTTDGSGELIPTSRGQKQRQCYNALLQSIYQEGGAEKYDYLKTIKEVIDKNNAVNNQELLSRIMQTYAGQSFFALYEITDTPVESNTPTIPTTQSGATVQ